MLPAKFRLKNKKEFSEVFKKGKSFPGQYLLMRCLRGEGTEIKIGFSAGLKFSKSAVRRNKGKRWMREAARTFMGSIHPGSKIIFVLSPKTGLEELNLFVIQREMRDLLQKGKLL